MAEIRPARHWIGFDLGGTKMLATVYDADFNPIGKYRTKTKGHEGAEAGLSRIITTIHRALEDAGVDAASIHGLGIGCPGPLDLDRGILEDAPNLGWSDVPVKAVLEESLDCPVIIMNDVDAGIYGEYRFGAARDRRTALGVFPGTGIGGGCVYEGQIIRGSKSTCMEIGHIQIMPEGPLCGCGRRGCLEAVASRLVIASRAAAAAYRGQAPHLLKEYGTNLTNIRSGALAESIAAGDEVIELIVREAARHIGRAVASAVHLLAPDVVVLGGGMVEAMPELFVTEVRDTAKRRVLPTFADTFEVAVAELGDDAGVLGAAAWAESNAVLSHN
jgi:glucokinase